MQPIDKDKIVAEIKRLKESFINERDAFEKGYHHGLDMVLYFLDTLETKEVDLENAFIEKVWDWIEDNILSSNQQDKSRLYFEQFKKYVKGE